MPLPIAVAAVGGAEIGGAVGAEVVAATAAKVAATTTVAAGAEAAAGLANVAETVEATEGPGAALETIAKTPEIETPQTAGGEGVEGKINNQVSAKTEDEEEKEKKKNEVTEFAKKAVLSSDAGPVVGTPDQVADAKG